MYFAVLNSFLWPRDHSLQDPTKYNLYLENQMITVYTRQCKGFMSPDHQQEVLPDRKVHKQSFVYFMTQ